MTTIALLPSPLLGAAIWEPAAQALRDGGVTAEVIGLPRPAPTSAADALDQFLQAMPENREFILVPHSNAGPYVAGIVARRRVKAIVFVDAGVPRVGGGTTPMVPKEMLPGLVAIAGNDGLLPVWTWWWEPAEVASLFPSDTVRERIEREQRQLPLSYFEDSVPAPPGWADRPCAYLGFGSTYQGEAERARSLTWPVQVIEGRHLEMVVHPKRVASEILALLSETGTKAA